MHLNLQVKVISDHWMSLEFQKQDTGCVCLVELLRCNTVDRKWALQLRLAVFRCTCLHEEFHAVKETFFFFLFNFSELQCDESLQTYSMSRICIFCTQSLSGHVLRRSRFIVLFTRHFPISLMCTCRQCVWNVTLICMLTTISSEIIPSWLMATLLPQKPPWAMWYDSPVIRH